MKSESIRIVLLILFSTLFVFSCTTQTTGKVIKVLDDNTFVFSTDSKKQIRVCLYGIDIPDKEHAYGTEAHLFLSDMIAGKKVTIIKQDTDWYGRTVAKIKTDSIDDVGLEMIKVGLARTELLIHLYIVEEYRLPEYDAKLEKRGLWAD